MATTTGVFLPDEQEERLPNNSSDFSRIRNADLGRFTLDRLISVIDRLGSHVDVKVKVRSIRSAQAATG